MDTTRRIILGCYSLLLIALAGGLIGLSWNQGDQLDLHASDWRGVAFVEATDTARTIATIALAAVIAVGLFTLYLAFARGRSRRGGTLELKQADGGTVRVTGDALEQLLRADLERLPEVRRADPKVFVRKGAVEADITATLIPETSIAHATTAITNATRQTLQEQVGVTNTHRPSIRIEYDDDARRERPTRGMTPEPMAVAQPAPSSVSSPTPSHTSSIDRDERPVYPPEPAGLRERDRTPGRND
jgi:hypothetical protein